MKIYISGKITGLPLEEAQALFQEAEDHLNDSLKEHNPEVINPMKIEHNHGQSWEEYMREDIYALLRCKAIYMLNNWGESRGARLEYAIAKEIGLVISFQEIKVHAAD